MASDRAEQAKLSFKVRPDEVDPYGIAHHSRYAVWAEMALRELLRARASEPSDEARQKGLPAYFVRRFQCKYQLSARLDDTVEVSVRPGTPGGDPASERFVFQVLDGATHRLFASGELEVQVKA